MNIKNSLSKILIFKIYNKEANNYKKFCIYIISSLFCIISVSIISLIIIDPLQLFHKSYFYDDRLNTNMRFQAAGIINNFDFDSIITGASTITNTSAKEASEKLGGIFFNIGVDGSNFYERSYILHHCFKRHLKTVLCTLDMGSYLSTPISGNPTCDVPLWDFLYDDKIYNDLFVYFTSDFHRFIRPPFKMEKVDLDRPSAWHKREWHANRFGGLNKWVKNLDNPQVKDFLLKSLPEAAKNSLVNNEKNIILTDSEKEIIKDYIEKYLLIFVQKNRQTKFILLFPSYYRFVYANMLRNKKKDFLKHQFVIQYMALQSDKYKNLEVYGFEDESFIDDIANFKDNSHHHYRFNSIILDNIAKKKGLLTAGNVSEYLQKCQKLAENFDIVKFNADAQKLIEAKQKNR